MDPISLLSSIVKIALAIHAQVNLAQSNQKSLQALAHTMQRVIASLQGLAELPRHQQFIDSLKALQTCLQETEQFTLKMSKITWMEGFARAGKYASKIDEFKQRIVDLVPFLNLGLAAQQLIDREQDRRDREADRAYFMRKEEQHLREVQAPAVLVREVQVPAPLNRVELEDIVLKQLASFQYRLEQNYRPPAPIVLEKPLLPEELIVNLYDIVFKCKIGESSLGALYYGTWREQPVTIKRMDRLATEMERQQFIREAQVMSRLHNEFISSFYGACIENQPLCLLTGLMEKGNLNTILFSLNLPERLQMAQDLARGLAYLHDQGVVHGNINPKTVGINQHNQAKWTDFGLVKTCSSGIASIAVTSREACWQAPESWQCRSMLSKASDQYSFGVLLWTLMTGRLPYTHIPKLEVMSHVQRGYREEIPVDMPSACAALIQACWSPDVSQRPCAIEIVRTLQTIFLPSPPVILPRASSPSGAELYESGVTAELSGNTHEAYQYYNRSANKNCTDALTQIGFFALEGLGGQVVDRKKAQHYFERAAVSGDARAMFNLGRMHEKGDIPTGISDLSMALTWYHKALTADPEHPRYQSKVLALTTRLQSDESKLFHPK